MGRQERDKLIPVLKEAAFEKDAIVHCDETWCKVRKYHKYDKEYMCVLVNRKQGIVIFFYDNGSRGRRVLTDFLGEADLQALMSDGYNAYTFLDGELSGTPPLCMTHARAKFVIAANHGEDAASEFVEKRDELLALESHYRACGYGADVIRQERQGQKTDVIVQWLRRQFDEVYGMMDRERVSICNEHWHI